MPRLIHVSTILVSAVLALAACTSSDSDDVTHEKCERLRDHVIDVQLAKLPASLAPPTVAVPPDLHDSRNVEPKHVELPPVEPDVAGHRAAMTQALGEAFVTSCQKNLTTAQLKCALTAADAAALADCETSPSK